METKRPRSPTLVETLQEGAPPTKQSKLVLKPPKFITDKKQKLPPAPTVSSTLESVLEYETAEQILESLISLIDSNKLQILLAGRRKWPSEEGSKCLSVVGRLAKAHRGDIAICCVLVRVLEVLALEMEGESEGIVPKNFQMFVLSLVDHDDADVKVSVLKCLSKMVTHCPDKLIFNGQVLDLTQRTVNNAHHGVRIECLHLIGQLCHVTGDGKFPLAILEEHCVDPDPRVRSAAFQALYHVHKVDPDSLALSVYFKASEALSDKYSAVRTRAIRLVWALALHHPDKVVPLKHDSSVELRLLDDAFIKICDLVNDSSMSVRALASGLLGDFHMVSEKFLAQTLDKKLMSHLKIVKSDHQRQKELHQGGGGASKDWNSGRKWGGGASKIELNPREISLMTAGACGAFVHGLEDEFMEVRSAAVGSMCQLGMKSRKFGLQSLDYLVDMFNDEIEAIRLKSINSLCKISSCLELREDQLETVLSILEESSSVIREALRELLSSCRISTSAGLNTTVHSLLENLKKYPHDCQSIWKCLQQLGGNHGYLISSLVPELLSTHPFFMGKEPDMDDPAYICVLILVFNAATCCPTIPPLFPSHVFRHYTYLRDTLPHLIPSVKIGMPLILNKSHTKLSQAQSGTRFLNQVLARARGVCSKNTPSTPASQTTLSTCITDLLKMASLDKPSSATNKFAALFLQCQLLIIKVDDLMSQEILLASDSSSHHSLPIITSSIKELLLLSYRLEHAFCSLSPLLSLHCRVIRIMAHTMSLLLAMHMDVDTEHSAVFGKMKQSFVERLEHLAVFCKGHDLPLPPLVAPVLEMNLVTMATETLVDSLQPLTHICVCSELPLSDVTKVRECRGVLLEPQNHNREDFLKFISSLALEVHVEASLSNIEDPSTVAIQVKFPDGRDLLFTAKPSEVRTTGAMESRLDTSVILSHGVWTDPCQVEFSLVKRFSSDIIEGHHEWTPRSSSTIPSRRGESGSGRILSFPEVANLVHSHEQDSMNRSSCVLAISEVVKVNIQPSKETKQFL